MNYTAHDRLRMIEQAKEAQEYDESLWPTKHFSGHEEVLQKALRDLHLVIEGDITALARIKRECGAV